jgi:hypothetical protein
VEGVPILTRSLTEKEEKSAGKILVKTANRE